MRTQTAVFGFVAFLLWSVTPGPVLAEQKCQAVNAAAANGVSFGNLLAGEVYTFEAFGCVARNSDGTAYDDPDGNEHSDSACTVFFQSTTAIAGFTCPGLTAFSLVGKVGGTCLQLGSAGSFTAATSGELVLYHNDDGYGDNSGSWDVCVTGNFDPLLCQSVPAAAAGGVSFGQVVAGKAYGYAATGCAARNIDGTAYDDPDGNDHSGPACTGSANKYTAIAGFTCPELTAFSLVSKIGDTTCIQLGQRGAFIAPASGEWRLYFNDDIYGDNSGAWDVCVTEVLPVPVDVEPGRCPNGLAKRHRSIPVAILGTATFDVSQVDLATVLLEGVASQSATIKDVATPFIPFLGKAAATDCSRKRSDGKPDLVLTFDQAALFAALGPVLNGEVRVLHLTGALTDGTPIAGEDVVVVNAK